MKLGYLGFGNLARALDCGIMSRGLMSPENIYVCVKSENSRDHAEKLGHTSVSASELFAVCDTVVLAVKPSVFREMKATLSLLDVSGKRVVSALCGVGYDELKTVFHCPVMRIMPSIASEGGNDIIGYCGDGGFDDFLSVLGGIGVLRKTEEENLGRFTVAASCGIGFAAHIMQAYRDECITLGFSPEDAETITRCIFSFASGAKDDFSSLEARVATKGGATAAGISKMDEGIRTSLRSAFDASGLFEKR